MSRKNSRDGAEFRLRPARLQAPRQQEASAWSTALTTVLRYARTSRRNLRRVLGPKQQRARRPCNQLCAVRVMYCRNTTRGQWRAHGRYIARESAAGAFQLQSPDNDEPGRQPAQMLDDWQKAGDRRLWKLIVSPEFGDRVDLPALTCNLMNRMERDLGTRLEWVAVPHFNTEHPHVHIAMRGIRDDGTPLDMDRDYIRAGIRARAEEICTRQLGLRSGLDAAEAERREVAAHRFTSLDRKISRAPQTPDRLNESEATYFTFHLDLCSGRLDDRVQRLAARLATLESMGLARFAGENRWNVRRDFPTVLKAMQIANDRQKTLAAHGAVLSDPRLQIAVLDRRKLTSVEGRVLGHGEEDSGNVAGRHYMLLEGTDGKIHLIYHTPEMEEARSRGRLKTNSFIRLQKQFENGRPVLEVTDHGNADKVLQNRKHLEERARILMRAGVALGNEAWGGWLGRYYSALRRAQETLQAKTAQRENEHAAEIVPDGDIPQR